MLFIVFVLFSFSFPLPIWMENPHHHYSSPFLEALDTVIPSFSGFIFRTRTQLCVSGTCFAQADAFSERYRMALRQDPSSSSPQPPLLSLCHSKPLRFPISSLIPFLQPLLDLSNNGTPRREDVFWEGIVRALGQMDKMSVCVRCGQDAKTQMLGGNPPRLPFVFPTHHYLCHSLVLHGEILPEDSEYICRPSGNCQCKGCISSRRSQKDLPSFPFSPSKSPQHSIVSFSPRKRKRGQMIDSMNNNHNDSYNDLPNSPVLKKPRGNGWW